MSSTGAPDGDGEVGLPLSLIEGNEELQEVLASVQKSRGFFLCHHVLRDLFVDSRSEGPVRVRRSGRSVLRTAAARLE